jgi:serine/threonine protein kinase/WD40 repeat protein
MNPASEHDPLDRVIDSFLGRWRAGERPLVEEYAAKHPQLAEQIRELFPALLEMEAVRPAAAEPARTETPPERLGDYRILRLIGRGGMGVVYEAVQESLGRHVALKVLPPQAAADPGYLERFRREARAAARLHHSNIVPVFGVGEHEGVHYYAMQYIAGQGLDAVLDEVRRLRREGEAPAGPPPTGPLLTSAAADLLSGQGAGAPQTIVQDTPLAAGPATAPGMADGSIAALTASSAQPYYRSVARLGLQVAEALTYAHQHGLVHRDVKPANLLLDAAGQVWVTDFGLAYQCGAQAGEGARLTGTGDVLGTLRYLAPERINGVSDARGDVYALGLTLYELLTLRPGFEQVDRVELLYAIARQSPPRPRQIEPRIPRDLETIVLKATEKDPAERFASAADLAEELRRFLADETLRIRRTGPLERLRRWRRRNPVVASLSLAVALLLGVALVGLVVALLVSAERDRALANLERAERAEAKARQAEREVKVREHLARAAALRRSGQVGQRFRSLDELTRALRLDPSAELRREIRDEAVAALVLPDVEVACEGEGSPAGPMGLSFDVNLQRFARLDGQGVMTVGRLTATGEEAVVRLPCPGTPPFRALWMSQDGRSVLVGHGPRGIGLGVLFTVWKLDWQRADLAPTVLFTGAAPPGFSALAFRPDGRQVAVASAGKVVCIYDLETGRLTRQLPLAVASSSLAFHPGGDTLAVAGGPDVILFDVATGGERRRLRHEGKITDVSSVAWHPDGRRLAAAANDLKIHIWDAEAAGEVMPPWTGHTNTGIQIAFNHAGDRLVSLDWDRQTRLWDATAGRVLLTMSGDFGVQFSQDDTLLGPQRSGHKVRLWRLAAGRELRVLHPAATEGPEFVYSPVPHAEGRVLAAISQHGLSFFDLDSGEELASVRLPQAGSSYLRGFNSRSGWVMTSSQHGTLLWPAQPDRDQPHLLRVGPPRQLALVGQNAAGASPDGAVVALANGDSALVLHQDRPRRRLLLQPQHDVRWSAVSPDKRWVVTCSYYADPHASVQIWNAQTGAHVHNLPLDATSWAWFSPDSRWLATATRSQECRLWEVETWREVRRYGEAMIAFSSDRRTLALNDVPGQVRLVETGTDREVARLTGPEPLWYDPACFSPDGTRLIAVSRDRRGIYVWDLRSIRRQLREMGLDWEWPEFPLAPPPGRRPEVRVDPGSLRPFADFPDPRQAVAVYSISLAHLPLNPEAYRQRGFAYSRLGQWRQATADCTMFLALSPANDRRRAEVLFRRSNCSRLLKESAAELLDLLALAPLNLESVPWPEAVAGRCNDVAWNLAGAPEKDRQPDKALTLARKAVALDPDNGAYRNTLGVAYYRLGRWSDAVAALEANTEQDADGAASDHYFLAMSWHHKGDNARARDHFNRAVRWYEENEGRFSATQRAELQAFRAEAEALLK